MLESERPSQCRVVAVNVRSGSSRSTAGAIVARALSHRPDAVVLSEYRDNAAGSVLRAALNEGGLREQCATEGHTGNGVLIAAKQRFAGLRNPFGLPDDEYPHAVIEARFERLRLIGVYL